jgi:hypothetical protein
MKLFQPAPIVNYKKVKSTQSFFSLHVFQWNDFVNIDEDSSPGATRQSACIGLLNGHNNYFVDSCVRLSEILLTSENLSNPLFDLEPILSTAFRAVIHSQFVGAVVLHRLP